MGYQALLFCPDEKMARVVSQVFSELDFTVEPVHEPFAAVKKLMAQRYDAIVVDCDNEQNASLLFKSARNSSSNQNSLAIAVVEGQMGVAKAYRIGANLVLTKPVNVEQAKGTLRVARGLLRKNSEAAAGATAGATAARTTPASAASSFRPASPAATGDAPQFEAPPAPAFSEASPVMSASANLAEHAAVAPAAEDSIEIAAQSASAGVHQHASRGAISNDAVEDAAGSAHSPTPVSSSAAGSAAAAAPAKELSARPARQKENKPLESATTNASHQAAAPSPSPTFSSLSVTGAPTFAGFGEGDSGGSGVKKKLLIAAVIILALAAVGYFGFGKPGKSSEPPPAPVSAPQNSGKPVPAVAPISSPEPAPSTSPPGLASTATQPSAPEPEAAANLDKPSPTAGNPPATRIALDPAPVATKPASPPMVVKANPVRARTEPQSEEAPALQGPLAATSVSNSNLSGLMSSTSSSVSKPSLATVKISQGVSQGLLIKRVQPKYPTGALAIHHEGAVQIEATINKEGNVKNLKVLSGDAVLARAAVEAVHQWRYKPYYLNGEPVEIQTQITVNFKAN
jgi:protein TonB